MIEDLSDPIIHLIRNAVDHGIESPLERRRSRQAGEVGGAPGSAPGGRPHRHPDGRRRARHERRALRAKALEKGLITDEEANTMDDPAELQPHVRCPASRWQPMWCPTFPAAASAWTWCAPTSRSSTAGSRSSRAGQGHDLHHFAAADAGDPAGAAGASWANSPSPCRCRWCARSCPSSRRHPGSRRPRHHGRARRGAADVLPLTPAARLAAEGHAAVRRADAGGGTNPSSWPSTASCRARRRRDQVARRLPSQRSVRA
jgi:hypothetical protein